MRVSLVLPSLSEATDPAYRPIKYSLFPPLGLATLAAHFDGDDVVAIHDEHVSPLDSHDSPDLVVFQCYTTSARRTYELADRYRARGAYVAVGGIHPTSLPEEAGLHADTVFIGPGDHSFPEFLSDFRKGHPRARYFGTVRSLAGIPLPRRDLYRRRRYLVPNSLVASRGCPHACNFCYKERFYKGGISFYAQSIDRVLAEIDTLPGRHLYFLDDQLFADQRLLRDLFAELRGMGRVWQAAGTVESVLSPGLMERAAEAGLRSLFVGFESLSTDALRGAGKHHNDRGRYEQAVARLHDLGIMINGSFVFGLDEDDETVFDATTDWAISVGMQTATFHILTPYPGTALYDRLSREGRILPRPWDQYDTRHAVFQPARMSAATLERGYRRAYRRFYRWSSLARAATHSNGFLRHLAYAGGWKKLEPVWSRLIDWQVLPLMRPVLEWVLGARSASPGHPATKPQ